MVDDSIRCTAKSKQTGERCRAARVPGATVCHWHGGKGGRLRKKIERTREQEEMQKTIEVLGGRRDIHPADALIELVQTKAAEVEYWKARLSELQPDMLTWGRTKHERGIDKGLEVDMVTKESRPHIILTLLHKAQDDLARFSAAALKAGVDEARLRIAETQAAWAIELIRQALARHHIADAEADQTILALMQEATA